MAGLSAWPQDGSQKKTRLSTTGFFLASFGSTLRLFKDSSLRSRLVVVVIAIIEEPHSLFQSMTAVCVDRDGGYEIPFVKSEEADLNQ